LVFYKPSFIFILFMINELFYMQYQHEEPCNDQKCTGRIKYLLQKTSMCPRFPLNLCSYGSNCWFAHSEAELKPMPKNEICMDHKKGQCMHADAPEKVSAIPYNCSVVCRLFSTVSFYLRKGIFSFVLRYS